MNPLHEERLRQLAYQAWQMRGCPLDSPEVDWQFALQHSGLVSEGKLLNTADAQLSVDDADDSASIEVLTLGLDDVSDTDRDV